MFWLYTALQCRSSISSNCQIFHTLGGISSSPAAFLLLVFLSTESSSSRVNCPSLMFNCFLIILVIDSRVTFRGFPSRTSIDKINENGFKLTKERNRSYPAQKIMDADYVDDIALLPNAPAQANKRILIILPESSMYDYQSITYRTNSYNCKKTQEIVLYIYIYI